MKILGWLFKIILTFPESDSTFWAEKLKDDVFHQLESSGKLNANKPIRKRTAQLI